MSGMAAVFFDLGDTLGMATVGGQPLRLVAFDVFPYVPAVLSDLKNRGLALGVISNTGSEKAPAINAVLSPTGLLSLLDSTLLVYSGDEGVTKDSPEIFNRAAARASLAPGQCLYVGEDAPERMVALSAGWVVCPHPLLVGEVLDGQPLHYVQVTILDENDLTACQEELRKRAFVPQHREGHMGVIIYGLTSRRVKDELAQMTTCFKVGDLGGPDLPLTTDLFLLRDDLARSTDTLLSGGQAASVFAAAQAEPMILSLTMEGVVAAIPPTVERGVDAFHFENAQHGHTLKLVPDPLLWDEAPAPAPTAGFVGGPPQVSQDVIDELAKVSSTAIHNTIRRYSGLLPLDGSEDGPKIESRHILESGNDLAVDRLVTDLEAMGLIAQRHQFTHAGKTLHNVEAEIAGDSPELILVTAHLDSTAAADQGFDPFTSPAPGADDDASGVAGVLAIAERFVALSASAPPARTIRFVLFNAEEQGLIGSRAYARRSKLRGETIAAVWQMDMIGFNAQPPLAWEVHAGFQQSPPVESRSKLLAEMLGEIAPQVAPELEAVKIHHSATPGGDPAAGRSDHASFQAQGYAACVISEDFFIDDPGGPAPDANPNYHRAGDTVIDEVYAAAITRAVAAAAWISATT